MANKKAAFATLIDVATGIGAVLSKALAGDAAAGQIGAVGFSFKDSSGNLVLPTLTAGGSIPVDPGAMGAPLNEANAISGSLTDVDVTLIALTPNKMYSLADAKMSCSNDALASLVFNDNGTPTILGYMMTGPGQFSDDLLLKGISFTAGATGTQELKVVAKNLYTANDIYAAISVAEAP